MTQTQIIELLYNALPCPHHISNLRLPEDEEAIVFTWRCTDYRVDGELRVSEISGGMLHGTDAAMLMAELLKASQIIHKVGEES